MFKNQLTTSTMEKKVIPLSFLLLGLIFGISNSVTTYNPIDMVLNSLEVYSI